MHNVYLNTDIIKRYGFEVEIARIMFYYAFGYELKGFLYFDWSGYNPVIFLSI